MFWVGRSVQLRQLRRATVEHRIGAEIRDRVQGLLMSLFDIKYTKKSRDRLVSEQLMPWSTRDTSQVYDNSIAFVHVHITMDE